MPPDVREWLPEDHFAWFVIDAVERDGSRRVLCRLSRDGRGRPAYEPAMMVALLLYAYARGMRSSRAIERACIEDVACRVIAAQQRPDHATIARFVERHQDALAGCSARCLALCARGRAGDGRGDRDRRHQGRGQRQPRREPSTTSSSRARSSRRRSRSTPPRTSATAMRAATSCRRSWRPRQGRRAWLREPRASGWMSERAEQAAADPALAPERLGRPSGAWRRSCAAERRANEAYEPTGRAGG